MLREQQLAFASKHVDTIQIGAPEYAEFRVAQGRSANW